MAKKSSRILPYQNAALPVAERVADLLRRMTLEEKIGQMIQLDGRLGVEKYVNEQHAGSFLHLQGDGCVEAAKAARKTRLGIPILLGEDAIHGYSFWSGATIFPTQLGCACSWDEEVTRDMGEVTARELRYSGVAWTFAPVFCIARDLRWGRVGETFGEDPYLIGKMGASMIRGLQGETLGSDPDKVMACAKHYAGYSETQGGRDASEADTSRRKLESYFLPPFRMACEAGAGSFMTGYQSMEGVPSTANRFLLRETLKEKWGFEGFVITDWNNVGSLVRGQKICADFEEAAKLAVESGNDMMMSTPEFFRGCLDAVNHGKLSEKLVDESVSRILTAKFKLGLFEDDRMADIPRTVGRIGTTENRALALRAAREAAVLLKNDGILPLRERKLKSIAVVGPNADDAVASCGDWSLGTGQSGDGGSHPRECYITSLDGIRKRFKGEVRYESGASITDCDAANYPRAMRFVRETDLTVAVVGDRPGYWGEGCSTATLELMGDQLHLLDGIVDSGKPFVLVIVSSKPLVIPERIRNHAQAIIQQFSPGMLGGQALAEILFGDIAPEGRLPISIPLHVGQQPCFYNQVRGQHGDRYADLSQKPLYPFGYGLTYTTIEYRSAKLNRQVFGTGDTIGIEVELENTGRRSGAEVVQLYVSDLVTSATWVDEELKAFSKVRLAPGEKKRVKIELAVSDCSIVNAAGERVVEPGDFELRIGASARDIKFVLPFAVKA